MTPDAAPAGALWCTQLELSSATDPVTVPDGRGYAEARVLVRVHGDPVGFVDVPVEHGVLEPSTAAARAVSELGDRIERHLRHEGLPAPERSGARVVLPAAELGCPASVVPDVAVTVVVCTRNRPEVLRRCLTGLTALTHPRLDLLVVDNAPDDDATRLVVEAAAQRDGRLRYVREPRPGLSAARNRGLAEARGDVVAYTDDDVAVDAGWVTGLARGFQRRADVACVTGLVASAALDTPAERYFDARVSWSNSCEPRLFAVGSSAPDNPLFPYQPGLFGTGASFAFRTAVLRDLGGFDEALGAGSRTAGGEDLDAFVRVLLAGHALAYEPSALVWHHHRSGTDELRTQMHAYGTGLTAFVAKHLLDPVTRREVLRRIPPGLRHLAGVRTSTRSSAGEQAELPPGLLLHELRGMAVGPVLYARARRDVAVTRGGAPA